MTFSEHATCTNATRLPFSIEATPAAYLMYGSSHINLLIHTYRCIIMGHAIVQKCRSIMQYMWPRLPHSTLHVISRLTHTLFIHRSLAKADCSFFFSLLRSSIEELAFRSKSVAPSTMSKAFLFFSPCKAWGGFSPHCVWHLSALVWAQSRACLVSLPSSIPFPDFLRRLGLVTVCDC